MLLAKGRFRNAPSGSRRHTSLSPPALLVLLLPLPLLLLSSVADDSGSIGSGGSPPPSKSSKSQTTSSCKMSAWQPSNEHTDGVVRPRSPCTNSFTYVPAGTKRRHGRITKCTMGRQEARSRVRTGRGAQVHEEEVVVELHGFDAVDALGPVQQRSPVQHTQRGLLHDLARSSGAIGRVSEQGAAATRRGGGVPGRGGKRAP